LLLAIRHIADSDAAVTPASVGRLSDAIANRHHAAAAAADGFRYAAAAFRQLRQMMPALIS